jgi:hypothetical protein
MLIEHISEYLGIHLVCGRINCVYSNLHRRNVVLT